MSKEREITNDKTHVKDVLLHALTARLRNDKKEILSGRNLHTGSMCRYATKEIVSKICYDVLGQEKMTHILFGSVEETRTRNHFTKSISSLSRDYSSIFKFYDQQVICSNTLKIRNGP